MIKIAIAVPYVGAEDLIKRVFEEHNKYDKKMSRENEEFHLIIVQGARVDDEEIQKMDIDADVLIARGATVYGLRKKRYPIPIAEIPISGTEMLIQLNEIKKKYPNVRVGVVGTKNMTCEVEKIANILDFDVKTYLLPSTSKQAIMSTVKKAVQDGRDYIFGGYIGVKCAKEIGVKGAQIQSGSDSIWKAISEAKRIAISNREERAKAMEIKTILDYAYEGVITVDKKGEIKIFNSSAEKILAIDVRRVLGQKVDEIFGNSKLGSIMKSHKEYKNEVVKYDNIHVSLNKRLLMLEEDEIGSVVTFQNINNIQEQELKIRDEIYKKGHYAKYKFEDIAGESTGIKETVNMAKRYAKVNSNILIYGETGTGKELFAQSIHNESERRKGPFVAINCAALPENLLESELFGYEEGAFTGAVKGGKIGLFELAHKGTILLDEISEVSLNIQVRLLRVLQEKEIMRIGSGKITPIDVRVIASTNKDLATMVEKGEFREDLFYRLKVLYLRIPALRNREKDVILLSRIFIERFCKEFFKAPIVLTSGAERVLIEYSWKGNIRELRNVCEGLVAINDSQIIDEAYINNTGVIKRFMLEHGEAVKDESIQETKDSNKHKYNAEVKNREIEIIKDALTRFKGNKTRVAEYLGITRVTLWRKIKDLNIQGKESIKSRVQL